MTGQWAIVVHTFVVIRMICCAMLRAHASMISAVTYKMHVMQFDTMTRQNYMYVWAGRAYSFSHAVKSTTHLKRWQRALLESSIECVHRTQAMSERMANQRIAWHTLRKCHNANALPAVVDATVPTTLRSTATNSHSTHRRDEYVAVITEWWQIQRHNKRTALHFRKKICVWRCVCAHGTVG